jgi:GNAT superfamily N-acetyltransferase
VSDEITFRIGDAPPPDLLGALRESVGWAAARSDYPAAYDRYSTTVAGYTGDGELVAWAALVSDDIRHAFFVDVIVHPAYQRQGTGRCLVAHAVARERSRGISILHADFAPEHAPFYQACGFSIGGGAFLKAVNADSEVTPIEVAG